MQTDHSAAELSAAQTARILEREYGPRRAVAIAEAQASSLSGTCPIVSLLFADAARMIERSFVAADLAQHRVAA